MPLLDVDGLTGAYRREGFDSTLAHLLGEAKRTGAPLALAVFDVDHFKALNDAYGHEAGDEVLRTVVARVQHGLRDEDLVFRYGGDEFVVLLPDTEGDEARAVLARVHARVGTEPIGLPDGRRLHVALSVGVTTSDEDDENDDGPFARADRRLFRAKQGGRGRIVIVDEPAPGSGPLRPTRPFGRDDALRALERFLARPASEPAGPGSDAAEADAVRANALPADVPREPRSAPVLRLAGPARSGFGRMLVEAGVRARQAGRATLHVHATEPDAHLHLRALQRACAEADATVPEDASEKTLARALERLARTDGLLITVRGGAHLDPGSRSALDTLRSSASGAGAVRIIEAVADGAEPALPADVFHRLAPLTAAEVGSWLSAACGAPFPRELARVVTEATGGRPAAVRDAIVAAFADGALETGPDGPSGDPEALKRVAAHRAAPDRRPEVRLPNWGRPLVGRATWLAAARERAATSRLLVLTGPGGVGKSRLAAQLARETIDDAPDGTVWIDLRGRSDPADLIRTLAEAAGLPGTDDPGQAGAALGERRVRWVLDEIDGVADGAGALGDLLAAAPGLRIVVTARRPLHLPDETVLDVPDLPTRAAATLYRTATGRGTEAEGAVASLLDAAGTRPLAIELAAAWRDALEPAELAEALARRPGLLARAPLLHDRAARTIDLTRSLMDVREREALGTLALIPGGFEPSQAREAAGASTFLLLAFAERALVRREGRRMAVHATIAERFASELSDPDRARRAVRDAYVDLARRIGSMPHEAKSEHGYRRVDVEHPNLRYAWDAALADTDADALWPLVRLLRGWMDVRGRVREGLATFRATDAALADHPDRVLRGWVRECVALFLAKQGGYDEAESTIQEALTLLRGEGDDAAPSESLALAWNTAGVIAGNAGRLDDARERFLTAAQLREAAGDAIGAAQARGNVAMVSALQGRPTDAVRALRAAADRYRSVRHDSGLALTLGRLAALRLEHGLAAPEAIAAEAREGLDAAERIGYAVGARACATTLGDAARVRGDVAEARTAFETALAWARVDEAPAPLDDLHERLASLADEGTRADSSTLTSDAGAPTGSEAGR